jgi:hypothetical protein
MAQTPGPIAIGIERKETEIHTSQVTIKNRVMINRQSDDVMEKLL